MLKVCPYLLIAFVLNIVSGYGLIAQEHNFINYNVADGLPQSQVFDLFQDHQSYIWIASQGGGAAKFDGAQFTTLTTKEGLPSNYVNRFYQDDRDVIWIGTKNGLAAYDKRKIIKTVAYDKDIKCMVEMNDSIFWLGTQSGIYSFNKSGNILAKKMFNKSVDYAIINDLVSWKDEIWVATPLGIFIIQSEEIINITTNQGLLSNDIKSIAFDRNGHAWVAQFGGGVSIISRGFKNILRHFEHEEITRAQCIYVENSDRIWVGTQNSGIQIYASSDSSWTIVKEQDGLAHDNVTAFLKDGWKNMWIGTSGGGLDKYLGQNFSHFNYNSGLEGKRVYAVERVRDNEIWLSVDAKGISKIDQTGVHTNVDSQYIHTKCTDIYEDSQQRIWFSTNGQGLICLDTSGFRGYGTADGLPSEWIRSIAEDDDGTLWIATYANGIASFQLDDSAGLDVVAYGRNHGLPDALVTTISKGPKGHIWFSTKAGQVGYIHDNMISFFHDKHGLPGSSIRSIAFDHKNIVYVGTAGDGIYRSDLNSDSTVFSLIEKHDQLSSNNIYSLVFDQASNLWAGSEIGLDKIIFGPTQLVQDIQHYGKNEGFLGIETCHNAATMDSTGILWFGTLNGLSSHRPSRTLSASLPPTIHFTDISVNYEPIQTTSYSFQIMTEDSIGSQAILPHYAEDFGFNFKAVNIDYPSGFTYSWQLIGVDQVWSIPSRTESVNYSHLAPGRYTFRVKAYDKNKMASNTISTSFLINPAIWQRPLIQLLGLAFLFLLLYFLYVIRIKSIKNLESQKRRQLQMENDLLDLKQKALQLQMNPHFIFNALNSIQSLVVDNNSSAARLQISQFALLMRGILDNSKKERISLKAEIDTLEKYLQIEQFTQKINFDYQIDLPTGVDPDEIMVPPMLMQPLIENAIVHGLRLIRHKGLITLHFSIKNDLLICIIKDNGLGRERSAVMHESISNKHESTAIEVIRKRLEALKGNRDYTPFIVEDVTSEDNTVVGTTVTLILPLELTY